jgi:hypothetical protein
VFSGPQWNQWFLCTLCRKSLHFAWAIEPETEIETTKIKKFHEGSGRLHVLPDSPFFESAKRSNLR